PKEKHRIAFVTVLASSQQLVGGPTMFSRKLSVAGILLAATASLANAADLPTKAPVLKAPADVPFFFVNDNSISYHYEFTATNPGAGQTPKNVLSFTHFDVWKYGTNFFNVDYLKATRSSTPTPPGTQGYFEIYCGFG